MQYYAGQLVRVSFQVIDQTLSPAAPADPTGITFTYQAPGSSTPVSYVYPGSPYVVRDSLGNYHVDVDTTGMSTGVCQAQITTTGVQAATARAFSVQALPIP